MLAEKKANMETQDIHGDTPFGNLLKYLIFESNILLLISLYCSGV